MSPALIVVFAAAATAVVVWLWARSRSAALAERLRLLGGQLAKAETELAALRARLSELEAEKSRLDTLLTAERDALQQAQTRLTDTFKALATDALRSNNDEFLKRAGETLVKPVAESLKDVRDKITELEKTRASAYGSLSEQLKTLALAQTSLQTETTKLSTSLSTTKTAGTWGELQLRRVVELAGMVEHCDFTEQESAGDQRPDLVVHLPHGQRIVVDAKAPTDAYREAASTTDPKVRAAKLLEHAAKVRSHVDALVRQGLLGTVPALARVRRAFPPGRPVPGGRAGGRPGVARPGHPEPGACRPRPPCWSLCSKPPPWAGARRPCRRTPRRSANSAGSFTTASPPTSNISRRWATGSRRPRGPTTPPWARWRAS